MTLPGNVTICYLEEDIPQKAFFRIKPLFVKGNGTFEPVTDAKESFPDEGGIRIVPDKNESNRFKARMRTLGRYCVVDLTHHAQENDKIRPNKNYNPEKMEFNRNIIYSDVVAHCPDEWLHEVVRVDKIENDTARAVLTTVPDTYHVILLCDDMLVGPFLPERGENENEFIFRRDEKYAPFNAVRSECASLYTVALTDDKTVELVITADFASMCEEKDANLTAEAPAAEETAAEAPASDAAISAASVVPAADAVSDADAVPDADTVPNADAAPVAPARPAFTEPARPAPVAPVRPALVAPVAPVAPVRPTPVAPVRPAPVAPTRPAPETAPKPERPEANWPRPAMRPFTEGQFGLNPRKGKSLSEVIDDGWKRSRIEQLGSPIPGEAGAQPIQSPIDKAAESLKAAWALPEAHASLVDEMLTMDGFCEEMARRFGHEGKVPATGTQLDALDGLEEERLRLLGEVDEMRRMRLEKRTELMEELKQTQAAQIEKMNKEIERLKKECTERLRAAEDARKAQSEAQKALLNENELVKFALSSRAVSYIHEWEGVDESDFAASPDIYSPNGAQLVSDVRKAFETCGRELSNDEAVNLLACFAIGDCTIVSGPTGCGKTSLVRMMASALGLTKPGARRFVSIPAGHKNVREDANFKALTHYQDDRTPRIVLLDDANQMPMPDTSRGLMTWSEEHDDTLHVVATVQDDQMGYPVNARLLDRGFMIRMTMPELMGWNDEVKEMPCAEKALSMDALRQIFKGKNDIPGEVEARLSKLLERLNMLGVRVSHRALKDMRMYCAAVIPLMTGTPRTALDYAFAQRAMPVILATAKIDVLRKLPEILCDMPVSLALMNQPLPLPPV